jgi:hypothetical protein
LTIQGPEGVPLHSPRSERRPPLCHNLLLDSRLYALLLKFDEDLAAEAKRARCPACGGRLDEGRYPRKPRVAAGVKLPDEYDRRFSYSCATRTCRKRRTPASMRFLGRRVYLGAVVVLATAMQQGTTRWRASQLRAVLGVSLQTLARWREWWAQAFAESTFWKAARAAFSPPVAEAAAPHSLLARFAGDALEQLAALLRFLVPLSIPSAYVPDRRR